MESGTCCSRPTPKVQNGQDPVLTLVNLWGQANLLCKWQLYVDHSWLLAMRHDSNNGLRCSSRWAQNICFRDEKHEVLSCETLFLRMGPLFRRIGAPVSPDRTISKTNAPNQTNHPVFLFFYVFYFIFLFFLNSFTTPSGGLLDFRQVLLLFCVSPHLRPL